MALYVIMGGSLSPFNYLNKFFFLYFLSFFENPTNLNVLKLKLLCESAEWIITANLMRNNWWKIVGCFRGGNCMLKLLFASDLFWWHTFPSLQRRALFQLSSALFVQLHIVTELSEDTWVNTERLLIASYSRLFPQRTSNEVTVARKKKLASKRQNPPADPDSEIKDKPVYASSCTRGVGRASLLYPPKGTTSTVTGRLRSPSHFQLLWAGRIEGRRVKKKTKNVYICLTPCINVCKIEITEGTMRVAGG